MGADQKRKEARKRKFGCQTESTVSQAANTSGENGTVPELLAAKRREKETEMASKASTTPISISLSQQRATKKQKKDTRSVKEPDRAPSVKDPEIEDAEAASMADTQDEVQPNLAPKGQRFIVFIGNLPYTATESLIEKHFTKVQPKSVRHRTNKETGKSKGFAFLEFEGYDRMKTCLKLYHHSTFDDGESPARKLNVELTAGGGGAKSRDRKAKLGIKNEKLNEQRRRRAEEEQKQARKSKTTGEKSGEPSETPATEYDIHPSRRSRVPTT